MKPKAALRHFLTLAGSSLLAVSSASAATYYWEGNTTAAGYGTATGTWADPTIGNSTQGWTTANNGTTAPSASITTTTADTVNFGRDANGLGAGTITVSGTVATGGITFASGSGAIVLSGGTINLAAASTITTNNSSNTISSILSGAGTSLTIAGTGTLVLTGGNTYAGATVINGGTLDLGGSGTTGSLASTVLTLNGGNFSFTRSNSATQNFTTTNINSGVASQISVVAGNTLNLGTVARGTGGVLDFTSTGSGTVAADIASNTGGIMGGFTFGDTWAVANGANSAITGLASYTATTGLATNAYAGNIDVDSSDATPNAGITVNSLRFSEGAANTLTLSGTNTITTGGILVGSGVGSNLSTITGGTLVGAASKDLSIIQNNASGGLTISSVIANNGSATGLTKSGAGLLTLSGNNTFTGGLIIYDAGEVRLNHAGALNSTIGSQNAVTFAAGSAGTLSLNGNSVVVRSLNGPSGTTVQNASASAATLTIGNSANLASTFTGVIQDGTGGGALSLTKAGTGTLSLSGTNTFSGNVSINAGTLQITSAANLGNSANITFTGTSTLELPSSTLSQGFAINAGVTGTLRAGYATVTINNSLAGSGTLVASGGGTSGGYFEFTSTNNTFSGNIDISSYSGGSYPAGLTMASLNDTPGTRIKMSNTTSFTYGAGAVAPLVLNNRQIESVGWEYGSSLNNNATNTSSTVTVNTDLLLSGTVGSRPFTLGGSNTGNNTFAGAITNGAGYVTRLTKAGAGTWVLTNANTYTGGTTLTAGNLQVGVNSVGSVGSITSSAVGTGTLTFNGGGISSNGAAARTILNAITFTGNATLGDVTNTGKLTFSADAALGGATRTLTVNSDAEFSGIISSTGAFGITKAGFGNLILSGANSYSGTTSINAGTLAGTQTSGTPFGTGAVTLSGGVLSLAPTGSGSAVSVTGGTAAAGTLFTYNAGATLSLNRGSQTSLTYTFGGTGNTTSRGTNGTLILSTSNIANFGAAGTNLERFIMNGTAPTQVNTLVSGVVIQDRNTSNAGDFATYDATNGFTKATYTLSNTFSGSSNTSLVDISSNTSTGSIASYAIKANATVTNSGTITLGNGTNPAALILNGGSISGGTLASAATGAEFLIYTSGTSSISSAITTSTSGMSVFGPGSLTLSSSNSFTGGLRVNNSTLIISNDNQLGGANNALTLRGGTLQTSGTSLAIGVGARAITLAAGQDQTGGTFNVTSGTTTYQNASSGTRIISGTGSLTKTGTGILELTGNTANTYTGGTTVSAGKLLVNNTTGSGTGTGTVSVGASGTLGGTGAISGAVNVTGQLSPGASIETFATGTLSMANGSTLVHELDSFVAEAVGSDLLEVTGNLNLTGTVYLTLEDIAVTDVAFAVNDTFSLINYTGSWNNGLFTFGSELLSDEEVFSFGLNTWRISYNDAEGGLNYTGEYAGGTDSFVNITAVTIIPEPGTALLGGLGILLIFRRRR